MDLYEKLADKREKIAVVGLGYVGLPLAVSFSRKTAVIGYDTDERKIAAYRSGIDLTGDLGDEAVRACTVQFTSREDKLQEAGFFIVAVPTPINADKVPDLEFVKSASRTIGRHLRRGAIVVYESTVYPGVTEDICIPVLERESGLRCGVDFKVGYSPERINPGDPVHRLENITKIVSGMDEETLDEVARIYGMVVEAGVYRAESIKVAEAAKVIENAQRDINIAFMNELSMLFNKMGLDTQAVLKAARTKWNFMPFTPGLVGGHCIGIDPYYLTYKAEGTGYRSKIITAGRQVNDGMGKYVARQIVKTLVRLKENMEDVKVGILGLAYKENCSDIRNTKVVDMINELHDYGIRPLVVDPLVNKEQARDEYGVELAELASLEQMNALVVAVPHRCFAGMRMSDFDGMYDGRRSKVMFDMKGVYDKREFQNGGYVYWSL